ncbi:hypothetical protein M404DRAFT_998861, partial [Pisolithus tinctorius Marx 270]
MPASSSSQTSPASNQQLSTVIPPSEASHALCGRSVSDSIQITLPVVQEAVGVIPIAGPPLKAAISGLLAVLQVIDRCTQNSKALDDLTGRLRDLSCHMANAPIARTHFEESRRQGLIKMLGETAIKLNEMRSRNRGSVLLTQEIAGCSSKINEYLSEITVFSQMQLQTELHDVTALIQTQLMQTQSIMQFVMALDATHLPATIAPGYVIMVDATGREHNMLLDQCSSFDRLLAFLPGILHQCRPDEAEIQQWYIDKGQYDIVIDDGTNVTQLTRESDVWSTIQPGTKIVMRIITAEVVRSFSARCRCRCGKWNDVKVDGATLMDALVHGYSITCGYCWRRFQITGTQEEEDRSWQGRRSQRRYDRRMNVAESLIRNFVVKHV